MEQAARPAPRQFRNDPRTILYVHSSDELYGSDVMLLRLIRGLDRERFRPIVALPNDLPYGGLLSRQLERLGVPVFKLDLAVVRRRYLRSWQALLFPARLTAAILRLQRLIRREDVALVHSNTLVVWPGAMAALLTRRPHVWHIHELLEGPETVRRATGFALRSMSAAVVANSEGTWDSLFTPGTDRGRVRVIQNTLDATQAASAGARARIRREWKVADDEVLIGTIGRISRRKGQRELLLAARDAAAVEPRLRFVIVGDAVPGYEAYVEELKAFTSLHGLEDRVRFAGYRSDVSDILDALDLFVLPVLQPESFGLAAVEAMAHGKAVIASQAGALAHVVVDEETGLLLPPGDQSALTTALIRLGRDGDLRDRMGSAGRARAAFALEPNAHEAQFETLYTELLGREG